MFRKTLLCLGVALTSGLVSQNQAHALPLLAENAGIYINDLITAYPDHEDPNLVYFMPNSSVMARDAGGLPQFGFTYWGLSNGGPLSEAGAYMTFTARLAPDESQKRALEDLRKQGKRLAVLPVQSSLIGLTSSKDGSPLAPLFSEFNFAKRGGRGEDEVGVNALLTGIGAKVFKAAIDNPQLIKADYCYKVVGLGPNFDAKITVDFKRVYDFFQASYSVGTWLSRKSVQVEVEKLRQEGAVNIEINGGDAKMEEYVQGVAAKIVERIFKPELSATPGGNGAGDNKWSFSRLSVQAVHREELKKETWMYKKRENVEREFCANIAIKDLIPFKDKIIKDADHAR